MCLGLYSTFLCHSNGLKFGNWSVISGDRRIQARRCTQTALKWSGKQPVKREGLTIVSRQGPTPIVIMRWWNIVEIWRYNVKWFD